MVDKTRVFHQAPSPCVVHFLKLVLLAATNSLIGDLVSEWACKNCKWRPKTSFSCRKIKFFFLQSSTKKYCDLNPMSHVRTQECSLESME